MAALIDIAELNPARQSPDLPPDADVSFVPMASVMPDLGGMDASSTRKLADVQKGYTQFRGGDVLWAKITPCMENGKVAIAPQLTNGWGYGSTEFHVIRPAGSAEAKWLAYFLSQASFRRLARANMAGTAGQLRVPDRWLGAQTIPVAPVSEQRRIVERIEELFSKLDAGVAALKRVQANLKRYRASVLQAACEGRLVPTEADLARQEGRAYEPADQLLTRILHERRTRWESDQHAKMKAQGKNPKDDSWKARYQEPAHPKTAGMPSLPAGWEWASMDQLADIQGGIQKQPIRAPRQHHFPFLRVANVLRNRLDLSEIHRIELFSGELCRLRLRTGDLLIVEGNGSPSEIGRMAVWNGAIRDCVHQNHIIRARPADGVVPQYAGFAWNSQLGARQIKAVASSTSGLYTLSVSKVAKLLVPLPPTVEQQRIVAEVERRLSIIDSQEAAIDASLKRAERLRQAILKRAFEGNLVPQDPTDEPASVLLERLGEERTTRRDRPAKKGYSKPKQRPAPEIAV